MRQLTFEETEAVCGAACGDLTMSVGLTGVSFSGKLSDWADCGYGFASYIGDSLSGFGAHLSTGIPYGQPHVL